MIALSLRASLTLLLVSTMLLIMSRAAARFIPGNGQIVFAEPFANSLYLVDVQRGWQTLLAAHGVMPSWSPDGTRIAFATQRGTSPDIYLFDFNSGVMSQLTDSVTHDASPAWSPDGTRIAFVSARDGDYDIYTMNDDGSNVLNLTDNSDFDNNPSWSPDGRYIAFDSNRSGRGAIYVIDTGDAELPARALTDSTIWAANPAWSPDGTQIAFEYYITSFADIFIINADGTGLRNLTNYPGNDLSPTWSPDGSHIAFISPRQFYRQLFVIDVVGEATLRSLTLNDSDKAEPAWQP